MELVRNPSKPQRIIAPLYQPKLRPRPYATARTYWALRYNLHSEAMRVKLCSRAGQNPLLLIADSSRRDEVSCRVDQVVAPHQTGSKADPLGLQVKEDAGLTAGAPAAQVPPPTSSSSDQAAFR